MSANGRLAVPRGGRVCCGCSHKMKKIKGGNVPLLLQEGHGYGIKKDLSAIKSSIQKINLRGIKPRYISI
jgi:hypothetical protein